MYKCQTVNNSILYGTSETLPSQDKTVGFIPIFLWYTGLQAL